MSDGHDSDHPGGAAPRMGLGQRLLLLLPRLHRDPDKAPLGERLRSAIVKPVEPGTAAKAKAADRPLSVEELEDAVTYASDKERLTGLLLAPVAAAIGILIVNDRISQHQPAHLASGKVNPQYLSLAFLHELELVFLALALVMMFTAYFRKRLFLGISMALYGLSVFNLHYWGFGVPYILVGAWLLVAAYRLQRDLKEATAGSSSRRGGAPPGPSRAQPNKRYTPRAAPPKRPPRKPENEQKAG